ncbi:REST corepressor 1-like [Sycon ciliatum]|uniref:REST corepressor 1-like n=1 Tax=Sycon ciliatum TaxID=27933 RepID=UPI0031F6C330
MDREKVTADSPENGEGEASGSEMDPDAPRMRVGDEYQAEIPDMLTLEQRVAESSTNNVEKNEPHVQHWDPAANLTEQQLTDYIDLAKNKYSYNVEQAMGMLYYHGHSIDAALQDLQNFTPFPSEWTAEEEVIFQQAFKSHGKSFRRIRSMLTQKSIPELVHYYYRWKQARAQRSLIDRKLNHEEDSEGEEEEGEGAASDSGDSEFEPSKETNRRIGKAKQTNLPPYEAPSKKRMRLPKGMYLDANKLTQIGLADMKAGGHDPDADIIALQKLSAEIVRQREKIQQSKQSLRELEGHQQSVEHLRVEMPANRPSARWTSTDMEMAVQSVRHYGKDFEAMAAIIGTKNPTQCRNYFLNHHNRLNFDRAYEEYKNEQNISERQENGGEPMDEQVAVALEANEEVPDDTSSSSARQDKVGEHGEEVAAVMLER